MSTDQIVWKTNAWKDPNMVAGYANNVADMSGANLLKNRVETELFGKYAHGHDVLDVGVGTGRASIPLARAGFAVTGVDSSQAMLKKCHELAAGAPMELIEGDVAALPFKGARFDTVMALNTIAHFPHWQNILREWSRVLRPGGKMIFDMFSMDHDVAFATATGRSPQWGIEHFAPARVEEYYLRLGVEEFVESLASFGLRVQAIVPYSVFCGTKGYNRFLEGTALSGFAWDRLLSWTGVDARMFDFITFLEQEFIANLTSAAGCRYMAVLVKEEDAQADRRWIERNRTYNTALATGLTLEEMAKFSSIDAAAFRERLGAFMTHLPNRFALARILVASVGWRWPIALNGFLTEPYARELDAVLALGRLDADVVSMLQNMHQAPGVADDFTYKGIAIGPTVEYNAMIQILDRAFHAFDGQVLAEDHG